MISDSQFVELDAEIWGLIGAGAKAEPTRQKADKAAVDAALPEIEALPDSDDERRIERIIEKARFEAVMKDSVGFLFKTMGVGVTELTSATIAAVGGEARSAGAADKPAADPEISDPLDDPEQPEKS